MGSHLEKAARQLVIRLAILKYLVSLISPDVNVTCIGNIYLNNYDKSMDQIIRRYNTPDFVAKMVNLYETFTLKIAVYK